MAELFFTQQLARFTAVPRVRTSAAVLRDGLECAFAANPRLRGYLLDDQGQLRVNIAVFVDGRRCTGRRCLETALAPDSQVYVLQALSGG